jgi:hypothetical protein
MLGGDESAIVQMIFGDNAVDIQQLLIKMIANSTKSSAMALRQALLALSFQFFVVPSKAIQHQNEAIQHLQATIDRSLPWDNDEALQAIAASMLLSVYEVCPPSLPFPRFRNSNNYSCLIKILIGYIHELTAYI